MNIKKLEGKERFDAYMTAVYCFHMRVEDTEAEREKYEADTKEDWGAFDEKGTLMGRILNHKYDLYLDGSTVRAGGIGAVATLPEYRDHGVIKAIFRELLPAAYKDGEVISTLYPFKHEFYRKQGYEVLTAWNTYSMRPGLLCRYRFDGEVKKWESGDRVSDFKKIYDVLHRDSIWHWLGRKKRCKVT
ncbi:MAG: GNAT family N-acetyltransferase [Lachnospiraceae bacterium]|nr:GNAT family N-acetyltransferase [Lachnospiraceae bacterium]